MQVNWVLHIFILHLSLEQIFIFVFQLRLASSNLPENLQGAPNMSFHFDPNTSIGIQTLKALKELDKLGAINELIQLIQTYQSILHNV